MKAFRYWSFALLFIVSVQVSAQANYADYQKTEIISSDQFDNANGWKLNGYSITNGWLKSGNILQGVRSASREFTFDESKDFELELSAFMPYDMKGVFPAVAFGDYLVSILCKNAFGGCGGHAVKVYNKPGLIKINKADPIWGWPEARYVTSIYDYEVSSPNPILFTFRKVNDRVYIFYDKTLVAQTPYIKFSEPAIVLKWIQSVDYVTLQYITKSTSETVLQKSVAVQGNQSVNSGTVAVKPGGKYYGLIIGVSNYQEARLNLNKPREDAKKLKELLVNRYTFTDSTTFLLLDPTRQKLMAELFKLRKVIGPNDNLLIFYAGHGYWDEAAQQGYWWPSDATSEDPSNWLSNSDVREQIRSIKSAHTLLISDACFSGGIFKSRSASVKEAGLDIQFLYKMASRRAITSGTMTEVPDKSVFLQYLCKRLEENQDPFLASQQLFDSFRLAVINNSLTVPQDGVIAETGDEGGDFIFIRKK